MSLTRTRYGILNTWRMYSEVVVFVEGSTDITVFDPFAQKHGARVKDVGGEKNFVALVENLKKHNTPYVVIIDGHYEILSSSRSPHRRAIRLARHSVENYFWDKGIVEPVCRELSGTGEADIGIYQKFEALDQELNKEITEVVTLDIACISEGSGESVLKERGSLVRQSGTKYVDSQEVQKLIKCMKGKVSNHHIGKAKTEVARYTASRPIAHLLRGHLLFRFIHKFLLCNSRRFLADDRALYGIFAGFFWSRGHHSNHRSLKRRLQAAVREARELRKSCEAEK